MMPLGLRPNELDAYHRHLFTSHDAQVTVDLLHLDERQRGRLTGTWLDAQVNLQPDTGGVSRTATFTLYDPNRALHLEANSPFDGAVYFDRMIRVRHRLWVPELDRGVTAVPFVGPITKISREGAQITVECQDKAILALDGRRPMTREKGTNAVRAIRDFLAATGERRFRFRVPTRLRKKRLDRDYSIGWTASPWSVCQRIATNVLGLQLVYSCDGAAMLRPRPNKPVLWCTVGGVRRNIAPSVTSGIRIDYDASQVRNYVRVTGQLPAKKKSDKKPKKFTEDAQAPKAHPMSPKQLGRNGAERYLPLVIEDTSIKTHREAKQRAKTELSRRLPLEVTASWDSVPFFHLDSGDRIGLATPDGDVRPPFLEASIGLGLGGDMSVGVRKRVSRPRRTGRRAR